MSVYISQHSNVGSPHCRNLSSTIPVIIPSSFPATGPSPSTPPPPNPSTRSPGIAVPHPVNSTPSLVSPLCALKTPLFCNPLRQWLPSPSHLRVRRWSYILFAPQGLLQALHLHSLTPSIVFALLFSYTTLFLSSLVSYSNFSNTSSHPKTLTLIH